MADLVINTADIGLEPSVERGAIETVDVDGNPVATSSGGQVLAERIEFVTDEDGTYTASLPETAELDDDGVFFQVTIGRYSRRFVKGAGSENLVDTELAAPPAPFGRRIELDDLADVDTSGAADGAALVYDAADDEWRPGVAGGSMSASEILTALKTVDGPGSGLDADTLDGVNSTGFDAAGTAALSMNGHLDDEDPHEDREWSDARLADHVEAADPHGDRAYADGLIAGLPDLYAPLDNQGNLTTGYAAACADGDVDLVWVGDSMTSDWSTVVLDGSLQSWAYQAEPILATVFGSASVSETPDPGAAFRFHNLSTPGHTIVDHLADDFQAEVMSIGPQMVVIGCGLATWGTGEGKDTTGEIFDSSTRAGIAALRTAGYEGDITLVVQYEPDNVLWAGYRDTIVPIARQIVADLDCAIVVLANTIGSEATGVDVDGLFDLSAYTLTPVDYDYDGIHMNGKGHGLIRDRLLPFLLQGCLPREELATVAAVDSALAGKVAASLYDANSILKADSNDTPVALAMGASTILARLAAGGIVAATPDQLTTLLALTMADIAPGTMTGFSVGSGRIQHGDIAGAPFVAIFANGTDANPIVMMLGTTALGASVLTGPGGSTSVTAAHLFGALKQAATDSSSGVVTLKQCQSNPIFGNGSDGDATISGSTTLTRDMQYDDLVVTGTLNTGGFRVMVRGALTGNGTIHSSGSNASLGSAGAAASGAVYYNGHTAGGNGGPNGGSAGSNSSNNRMIGQIGGGGGAGSSGSGGAAGTLSSATNDRVGVAVAELSSLAPLALWHGRTATDNATYRMGGGTGGGGGGGNGAQNGGGGGGGGGVCAVFARNAAGFTGTIAANGGNGANGTSSNCGGGGGGGGGFAALVCAVAPTGSYNVTATKGTGGTATGSGVAGTDGTNGTAVTMTIGDD